MSVNRLSSRTNFRKTNMTNKLLRQAVLQLPRLRSCDHEASYTFVHIQYTVGGVSERSLRLSAELKIFPSTLLKLHACIYTG